MFLNNCLILSSFLHGCGRLLIGLFRCRIKSEKLMHAPLAMGLVGGPAHDKEVRMWESHGTIPNKYRN